MKLDVTTVGKALDLAYDKAVDGIPGVFGLAFAEGLAGGCNTRPRRGRAMICPSGKGRDSRVSPDDKSMSIEL